MDEEALDAGPETKLDTQRAERLAQIELFRDIPAEKLAPLVTSVKRRVFLKGQLILAAGDGRDGVFVVEWGAARLYRVSVSGHEVTLAPFGAGDIFRLSFLSPPMQSKSALEATVDGTVIDEIPRESFREFVALHPDMAMRVIDMLGRQVALLCDRIVDLALHDMRSRLAHALGRHAETSEQGPVMDTHQQLAAEIGTRQDEVTRALRTLREEGLVRSLPGRRGILVVDIEQLLSYGR